MKLLRRRVTWLRAVALLALAIAVLGALSPLVASVVSRRYRVWRAFPVAPGTANFVWGYAEAAGPGHERYDVGGLDPWGRRWRRRDAYQGWSVWSKGPDGQDDGGAGDDEPVDTRAANVDLGPPGGVAAALLVLFLAAALRSLLRPRGPELGAEVGRALFASSVPTLVLGLVVRERGPPELLERGPPLLVPREVAVVGAAWLVLALAALGWRVRASARRGRLALRVAPLLVATGCAAVAAAAAWRGREAILTRREREGLVALAFAGDAPSFARVCAEGEPDQLEALLAAAPTYRSVVRLSPTGLQRLGPAGARANQYVASGLLHEYDVWGAPTTAQADPSLALDHLVRHDPALAGLVAGLRARSAWRSSLVEEEQPLLVAALLGHDDRTLARLTEGAFERRWRTDVEHADAALHALLVLRADPTLGPRSLQDVARLELEDRDALAERLGPWLAEHGVIVGREQYDAPAPRARAVAPNDRWVVVAVKGAEEDDRLDLLAGGAPVRVHRVRLRTPLLIVGPWAPGEGPEELTLLEPRGDHRVTFIVPTLERPGAVWVDADLGAGRADARRVRAARLSR